MTFYHDDNLGNVINKFTNNGYNFSLEYLDGSEVNYYCTDLNRVKDIEKKMLEQAKERDEIYFDVIEKEVKRSLSIIYLLLSSTFLASYNKAILVICLNILLLIITSKNYFKNKKRLDELKKYRLFLSMYEDLKDDKNKNIVDILEFDKIYQHPFLTFNTIDNFKLSEVEGIKKEIIRRKELKQK